ncbi:hypothetical protein F511_35586 [Dorcoceras hygrometricum]|uniref:Uncharacterized protein n=1 Tax=Dorcoceras hygrometricum TaxID=472368 RepID=A0A2Z7AKL7_9LAMI|nr:hypothetical protein F511_35586 [Dorcoceras hygrometricum]
MFSKEDYDDWKIRMQVHLAALDDEMWAIITKGPLKIMKSNLAFAISNGEPQFLEKSRHEYTNSIGYPRTRASGESSITKHRLLHASGPHPILPPNDPIRVGKRVNVRHLSCRVSMTFRVVRTNQYNQDLGLIHSTNGNNLKSPNEGSSIDHQVTIHLHAQNITIFPTNETWYFASQMLVSSSGGLILILTANRLGTRSEYTVTIRCVS